MFQMRTLFFKVMFGVFVVSLWSPVVNTGAPQDLNLEVIAEIPGPVELVRTDGDYAYVSGGHTFTVYDLSVPSSPVRRGSYTFPEEIWGFRLSGGRAYVGANFFGLGILDVTNPDTLELLGQPKTLGQTKIGALAEGKVWIIDHMEGFVLIDVANETAPSGIGSFFLDGYARDVVTAGTFAFATDSPSGLYVFDLSREGEPEPVGLGHAPAAPADIEVATSDTGAPMFIVGAGGGDVQVYDVSTPSMPRKLSTFETPGRTSKVSLDGSLVFTADSDAGVHLVDLANPAMPKSLGAFSTPRPARDVSVVGDLVLVVVGDSEREGDDRHILVLERQ